jgi:hypothetical protein
MLEHVNVRKVKFKRRQHSEGNFSGSVAWKFLISRMDLNS